MADKYELKDQYRGDVTLITAEKSASESGLDTAYGLKQVMQLNMVQQRHQWNKIKSFSY